GGTAPAAVGYRSAAAYTANPAASARSRRIKNGIARWVYPCVNWVNAPNALEHHPGGACPCRLDAGPGACEIRRLCAFWGTAARACSRRPGGALREGRWRVAPGSGLPRLRLGWVRAARRAHDRSGLPPDESGLADGKRRWLGRAHQPLARDHSYPVARRSLVDWLDAGR